MRPSASASSSLLVRRPALLGSLEMIAASALFAVMAIATRRAAPELGAAQLAFVRFVLMAAGVLALRLAGRATIRPRNLRLLAMRGIFGGAAVLLYFVALARTKDAGTAALLQYTSPLFTNLFGWIALSERPSGRIGLGALVAFGGVLLVLRSPAGIELGVGELAALASSVIAGMAVVTIRAARATDDSTTILFAFSVGGALICLPFALPAWSWASPAAWGLALAVGVSSFFAQLLMTHAFGLVTAGQGALYQLSTPIFTFVLGALLLGEPFGLVDLAGAALTLVAIAYAAVPSRPR